MLARARRVSDRAHVPISSDKPLTDPQDDALGFATFARHLARVLGEELPEDGLVVALTGCWGSGKSTVLNFIKHELDSGTIGKDKTIVVQFNPWWFSGTDDLVRDFFAELHAAITPGSKAWKRVKSGVRDLAGTVSRSWAKVPMPGKDVAELIAEIFSHQKPLANIHAEVSEALRKANGRIVVLVDDIDRLTPDETRDLFRVVKAVASLPRVGYVLAFDRGVVVEALARMYTSEGEPSRQVGSDYLEKIVQLEVPLPIPDRITLRDATLERLAPVLGDLGGETDQENWMNVFFTGIEMFIQTPRDLARYMNAVSATYPAVQGEVNVVDFLALQALRVFASPAYQAIVESPSAFAGFRTREGEPGTELHEEYLSRLDSTLVETTRYVLMRVFPKLLSLWKNFSHGDFEIPGWRRSLRACVPELLPVYLRLEVPRDVVTRAEIVHVLELLDDPDALAGCLSDLSGSKLTNGQSRGRALLERLHDEITEDLDATIAMSAMRGVLLASNSLLTADPEQPGMMQRSVQDVIRFVVVKLLELLPVDRRATALLEALSDDVDIEMSIDLISSLSHGQERERWPSDRILRPDDLRELRAAGVRLLASAATDPLFTQERNLALLLYRWKEWGGEDEAEKWSRTVLGEPQIVARFVTSACSSSFSRMIGSIGMGDRFSRRRPRLSYDLLHSVCEPHELLAAVQATLTSDAELAEHERAVCELYLQGATGDEDDDELQQAARGLEQLSLRPRLLQLLQAAGLQTVTELELRSNAELLAIKGIGPRSVDAIRAALASLPERR